MKVIHSLTGRLNYLASQYQYGPAPALGLPPPLAGTRPDRGVMAVSKLPLFPSADCQRESQRGFEECQHPCDETLWAGLCVSKVGKEHMGVFGTFHKRKCVCVLKGAIVIQRLSQHGECEVMSLTIRWETVLSWRSGWGVVFVWYMVPPQRPELWKQALLTKDQVQSIVFTSESGNTFLTEGFTGTRGQRFQQNRRNSYFCTKWYRTVSIHRICVTQHTSY